MSCSPTSSPRPSQPMTAERARLFAVMSVVDVVGARTKEPAMITVVGDRALIVVSGWKW